MGGGFVDLTDAGQGAVREVMRGHRTQISRIVAHMTPTAPPLPRAHPRRRSHPNSDSANSDILGL